MEGYAAGWPVAGGEPAMAALEAAGDAVAAGLGRVMVQVACLFAAAAGTETLAGMEQAAVEASREIGLGALQLAWSPGNFVDISIMLLLVPNCQIGARNPLGLSCRAGVVSGRDCNIARCSRTRRS